MANGFMNPFGTQTSIPFLFGEDPASQQARESFQAAGDVAQQLIGLQDARSPELLAQLEEEGVKTVGGPGPLEAFLPASPIGGLRQLGGLQKLSRFKPSATPSQLPVLRGGQLPDVPGGRPPVLRTGQSPATVTTPPSTFVRGTGPRPIDAEVLDVPKGGGLIPSLASLGLVGALLTDQAMQEPSQGQVATAPEGVTQPQPTLTTVPGLEGGFGGMGLSEFLAPDRAKQEASRAAFEQASKDREARLEADLAASRARRLGISSEDSGKMSMSDYKQLARQAGMKGSAVNAMAKQMQQEAEAKAKKAEADIAATEALIAARSAPKATTVEKDLADIESRFALVGVPFRNPDGTLTQAAEEAILAKGRIGEASTLGSGLTLTDDLARQFLEQAGGNKEEARRLATEAGYTVS